jgi:hypothetical protein
MPVETEVWVNGYYAGVVDDFDGIFQRLYLPAGQQEIELYLDGYEPYRQQLFLSPGGTTEISHQMQPLRAGERLPPPDAPMALPEDWMGGAPSAVGDRPASPFGILALRIDPADAQILIDGEVWLGEATLTELVIHVPSGWHRLEVRRDGYQTFRTEIELSEGATTRLNVRLER